MIKVKKEFEEAKDALEKEKEVKNQSKKRSYSESFLDAMVTPTIKDAFEKGSKYPAGHPKQVKL